MDHSSARMAGIVCANSDQIPAHGRWISTTMNDVYLTRIPREMMQSMVGYPTNGRFFYLVRAALDLPTFARNCSRRSTNGITDWRQMNLALTTTNLFKLPPFPMNLYRYHDAQEDLYTRLGAYDGTPPLISHLATFHLP
ncbi:hypothetical protein [Absidia glauca]|uniref:Ndc10 domain-containing protein n=1 Tax=Absidia glauca TaxID=4829 RepID=A0A168S3W1_ABSGL|nr:hypothetical protein [Absidia glauca]